MEEIKSQEEPTNEEIQKLNEEDFARMQQELEEARAESSAATDKLMRLAAEFDNYKKRNIKEQETVRKYAVQNLIKELLPILDNLERAINSANESKDTDSLIDGIKMVLKQLYNVLEKEGVSEIKAVGEIFDPNFHEAVAHVPSNEYPENVIIEEFQKGYILHDRVIRPAMVAVSKGPTEE